MKLKEQDAELNGVAPASLITLRSVARGGGTAPVAEFALWRLGQEYRDRRLYDLAASTFADLGTRFPETRYDAWFSAAELFEKQLKDAARAREAYAKVPAASPRYEAAQKKLASASSLRTPRFSSRRLARTSSRIGVPSNPNDSRSRLAR